MNASPRGYLVGKDPWHGLNCVSSKKKKYVEDLTPFLSNVTLLGNQVLHEEVIRVCPNPVFLLSSDKGKLEQRQIYREDK